MNKSLDVLAAELAQARRTYLDLMRSDDDEAQAVAFNRFQQLQVQYLDAQERSAV